ncbi:acyltransferase family protein [Bradyrhizobium sp. USDA 4454]
MAETSTSYRPELDGIRAICILFTVANHVRGTPWFVNGSVGVDIFFALSGWLITWLLLHDTHEGKTSKLASYYIRRVFRIVPLYALTIILYGLAALTLKLLMGNGEEVINFRDNLPYLATFNGEYMHQENGTLFGHSWTLGIEEKFYIIWPFIMVALWNSRAVAGAALVGALFSLIWLGQNPELLIRGYAGLSFGAALAVAASQSRSLTRRLASKETATTALVGIAGAYVCSLAWPHPFIWNVCIALFAAGLIGSLWLGEAGWLNRMLSLRPLTAAGRLTYTVYLTHVLVMNVVLLALAKLHVTLPWLALFVLCYLASIAVAYPLHRIVEKPLIEVGRTLAKRFARRAAQRPDPTVGNQPLRATVWGDTAGT